STDAAVAPIRDSLHVGDDPHGSNNWVIAGSRTRSGKPLLANDPHYSHAEAGFVFLGTPGMMTGRNDRIAWGFTNNGATIRDLYAERIEGDRYWKGDHWEPLATREVEIAVKGDRPVRKTIRATAHGPIVNEVLPAGALQGLDLGGRLQEARVGADVPALSLR